MKQCEELLKRIRNGDDGVRVAMKMMFLDTEFRKIARYVHGRCSCANDLFSWEDFLMECIMRFIERVLAGVEVRNCNTFFFGICDKYCKERCRDSKPDPVDTDDFPQELLDAALPYFDKLSKRYQVILLWYCFCVGKRANKKDYERLSEILKMHGYEVSPGVVPAVVWQCKQNLRDLIGDDLDDLFNPNP
ncbi:MAG TPA: hypothetical protein PK228_19400 [Saprospiraceae bacterium]|nr:hypothetical protein [Saprospiraceae bacterium]